MNTRCPPKRVPSAARFFTLCRLTVQPPQSYSVGGQRSSGQLTGKPAGARPDYRGRWCAVSRGHPGRPNPPSPRRALGQLSAAPWELLSTVGCGIVWTRTGDVQAIECILHSSECFYWMRHSGAQEQWYTSSMKAICVWLTDRLDLQLHMYQLKTLIRIVKIKPPSSYRYLGRQRPNRAGRFSGRRQHCPAFSPSRHSPTSWKRSWNHPALVPSVVKQATPLASLEGAGVLDLAEFPPVDSTIVALVRAPPVGGLPKDLAYPNSQCRVTKAHLNKDYAAEAQVTCLANMAGLLTAYLEGILQSAPLPEPVASELRLVSGTLLQISGFQGEALGRSLASQLAGSFGCPKLRVPDRRADISRPYLQASSGGDTTMLPPRT
ncbi:UNVERIFIED_CONTAM: hypothetical protein FKN15_077717 [Acipenser sinensis]